MAKTEIEVGSNLRAALGEVGKAWKDAEKGKKLKPSSKLCFVDWSALCAVMTPKRYEIVCELRREPESGIRALARRLGRDVKRVHADVTALEELGLIKRDSDSGRLYTEIDEVTSVIKFAA
jgi:predicted transcriptional regulator